MASSLSSVVSNLVRASMGSSVSSTDQDLDRHVAELILKEAKKKAQRYGEHGIRALLRNNSQLDSNAPRANKRFLSSIIRSTDDHNKTILRARAHAAHEIKRARAEQERRERRARAEEAVRARRSRRGASSSSSNTRWRRYGEEEEEEEQDSGDGECWDRWDGRTADRKRKARDWETWDGEDGAGDRRRRRHHRSRSRDHQKHREHHSERSRRNHDRSRSRSPRRERSRDRRRSERRSSRRSRSRSRSSAYHGEHSRDEDRSSKKHKSRRHTSRPKHTSGSHSRSPSPSNSRHIHSSSRKHSKPRSPKYALDDEFDDDDDGSRLPSPQRSTSLTPSTSTLEAREAELVSYDEPPSIPKSSSKRTRSRTQPSSSHLPSPCPSPKPKRRKIDPPSSEEDEPSSLSQPVLALAPRSPDIGPTPAPQLPSKMDKYFEEAYDPRLDVAPLIHPEVPATGLINNADFEGWDTMLELIRLRKEDKEEKKRMERLGLTKEKDKKNGAGDSVASRWHAEGVSIMTIEYKKRGAVREWDLGKEGF